ncbi:MAG TPA: tetratricopeptide repeat protein [Burkholderiaceae bacterium]|nr:tetratricopeptide repeat protein [Burkholderiaceae bacterium]
MRFDGATSATRVLRLSLAAIAVGAAFGGQIHVDGRFTWSAAQAQEAVRGEIGRPLQAARDLIKQKKYSEALTRLREVDAVPNRNANENFLLEQMRASAALSAGDNGQAIKAIQFLLNSGRLPEAQQAQYAGSLASLYYREKDYKDAAQWASRALRSNPSDGAMRSLQIQSYYLAGDLAGASREALEDVQAAEKAGRTPPEDRLQLLANIASKTGDRAAYVAGIERLVTYYPKKEYWVDLLRRLESKPGFSNRLTLDLYRLRAATKTLDSPNEVVEMAQLALQQKQAGEAKKLLDDAFASGLLGKGAEAERQKRLLALATERAAEAPAQLKQAEAEALASNDGSDLVNVGFAYTGLSQFEKGIALMRQAITQGKLKRTDEANLHLGIAYLRAGQKAKARETFKLVGGTDGTADLARLWMRVG